ncbi:acyl carrier protein [Streptomyces gilvus]|uniref:acyl carrier protein n=1 Tax=Streptomyces gilvus TaxID=2920937 RepID=UPI001F0D4DA2|nr:acyl carrier protein [Streptomyces sp. CME 23]MCH5670860.1 phosphopantetheine-binding protein [Streptomyces sp. CME 23]
MDVPVSDQDMIGILLAVGADRSITVADLDSTFEQLELDSLARAEFAAKLKERTGVDAEEQTTADATPNAVRLTAGGDTSVTTGR